MSESGTFQGQLVCCGGSENKVPRSGLKTCFVSFDLGLCLFNFLSVDHFRLAFNEPIQPIRRIRRSPKAAKFGGWGGGVRKRE